MITLENICSYLPYGLKWHEKINNHSRTGDVTIENLKGFINGEYISKIALYPMDLTKPIQVDGKEIYPVVELAKQEYRECYFGSNESYSQFEMCEIELSIIGICSDIETITLPMAIWLFRHKFDVFGLIEKGLAVDVNTLETNPYEPSPITNK